MSTIRCLKRISLALEVFLPRLSKKVRAVLVSVTVKFTGVIESVTDVVSLVLFIALGRGDSY